MPFEKHLALGREKLGQGDFVGALSHADAALALSPESFEALQMRSRALYLLGRDAEALQTLRRASNVLHKELPLGHVADSPDDLELMEEATSAEEMPAGTDAMETLLALRERYRLDAELLLLLAELAEDAGRFEIARGAFEELVALDPANLDAWEGLVHVVCHEDLDAALQIVYRALDRYPTHALFYEYLGYIRSRRHDYLAALHAYRQAIEYGADHPDNFESLAHCHFGLGEEEDALEVTRRLLAMTPNDAESHRFAVEVALHCRKYDMALQHAHQLVRLEPSHAETYCWKARVELAAGEWEAAERTLRLGFHKAMEGEFALFELVDELIVDNELEQALRVADLVFELASDHPESSAARGKVLREMGDFPEALTAFKRAAALAPHDDAYQTWLGVILDNMGDYHAAIRQFNQVLARHPSDVWTLSNRGLSYLALQMPEHALADFTRGIELDPEDAPLFFWRACALVARQEHDEALRNLRRALDLSDEILPWLEQEPSLDPLRHDPRFRLMFEPREGRE